MSDTSEFKRPTFANMIYKGIIFMTTGIMNKPNIILMMRFFPLKSYRAKAYPPSALTATLKAVLPKLTIRLFVRLKTRFGSVSTKK